MKGPGSKSGELNVNKWCGVGDLATKSEGGQVGLEDSQTNRSLRKPGEECFKEGDGATMSSTMWLEKLSWAWWYEDC